MKFRTLNHGDVYLYRNDIYKCYKDCNLIFDSQNIIDIKDAQDAENFIHNFVDAKDSTVMGILSDSEEFLYGIVIFDNIRFANKSCAQIHIVTDKAIWGRKIKDIYTELLNGCIFDTLYCEIPSIAVHPIAMCRRLGFKKTGYIPEALPYVNSNGEEKMYDLQIYTYRKKTNG